MSKDSRKYRFTWDLVGTDLSDSRPNLGANTTIEVYRLFQFTMREILEKNYGTEKADEIFKQAGVIAGKAFFERYCQDVSDLTELARIIQQQFKNLGMGIVRFEVADPANGVFQLTVDEDLDCSGLPDSSDQICVYDEGFIKGILDTFTGKKFSVQEVDCWCSGARTCRFRAQLVE